MLQIPEELIQKSIDNGWEFKDQYFLYDHYEDTTVRVINLNQDDQTRTELIMKVNFDNSKEILSLEGSMTCDNYELLFNPDYKFLEYAFKDEWSCDYGHKYAEYENGCLPCYEEDNKPHKVNPMAHHILNRLIRLSTSNSQSEYLKTLIL